MSDNAKYTFGGVSKRLGVYKVRVGQGAWESRAKMMIKEGHEDLHLINFGEPMTKAQICQKLLTIANFNQWADVIKATFDKKTAQTTVAASKAKPVPKATKAASKAKPVVKPKVTKAVKAPKVAPVTEDKPKRVAKSTAKVIEESDGFEDLEVTELTDVDSELASFVNKYGE